MIDDNYNVKRNRVFTLALTFVALALFFGVGFAYFSSTLSNTNHESITSETASIALKFDDNDNGVSGTLNLGESITKKFTLQNTGTKDAYAKISWVNLVNTYMNGSLTYNLEQSTSENGIYNNISSGKVPVSNVETTKQLANGILVPVNTTYYYKLTITLNNLDIEQNSDTNASFYSYFNLEEGSLSASDKLLELVGNANPSSTNVITREVPASATCTNTLAYDGTVDNNLRYVGANPCNYVTFNNEVAGWRIVGIMNNVDDGTGNLETRIKLIRATSLGDYSWDTSSGDVNSGEGINDWMQADLMRELNGDYLDILLSANTNWYNGQSNAQTGVFDYTKRLSAGAQELIGDAKWYLGGFTYGIPLEIPSTMYTKERGTEVWGNPTGTCNDGYCPRSTEWTGKVALIYPSDYGYATAGGETTNRSTCIETLSAYLDSSNETWTNSNYSDCKNNDWLKPSSGYNWLLSPASSYSYSTFLVRGPGHVTHYSTFNNFAVLPTVYLQSGVTISQGFGTESEPYVLE